MDGLPSIMIVNKSLKGYPNREEFPYHVWVSVGYRSSDELQGLPTEKEARALDSIEDALLAAVRKSAGGHYIGQTTGNGVREFNFYVDDPEPVDIKLESIGEQQKRPIQYEICEDDAWNRVEYFFDYDS